MAASGIRDVLERVLTIVRREPQDLSWQSRFRTEDELIAELTAHSERIARGDRGGVAELRRLFAPTGPLCEIAAAGGWLAEYTVLGNRLDELLAGDG
ncbi:hypothetical protein [Nocardia veterana]|uniref:Uncharacterized protein n=1 Tax=Nocardia veterana TaxID=132249 RepID=A0A7X6RJ74_9NOCA|nr:hypothetical protein [Nocardia veterana]NKY87967.1 hypothetical protein [Nocardia veterana]